MAEDENVVAVRGESLPVGIRLRMFTENLLDLSRAKLADGQPGISAVRMWLEGTGLEGLDEANLTILVTRYDDFGVDQRERWEEERDRAIRAGRDRLFEGVSDGFTMERAEFVGGLLGRLLQARKLEAKEAGTVLRNVLHLHGRSGSVFSAGGDGPSYEDFENEARQFEKGFEREFGAPLQAVLRQSKEKRP